MFLVLAKYKGILNKIMNGDPQLLLHVFKVKYLKVFTENIINIYQSVFPEKNFFSKYSQKGVFGGNYPLIFTSSG